MCSSDLVLFRPADSDDLAAFLAGCPAEVPLTVIGVGSNLLIRDGGVPGVVIRLGSAFAGITVTGTQLTVGAGALDATVALTAAQHGLAGLEFLSGIPGTIGGAPSMANARHLMEIQSKTGTIPGIDTSITEFERFLSGNVTADEAFKLIVCNDLTGLERID